jgi:Tfp pilus assembly protein PilO
MLFGTFVLSVLFVCFLIVPNYNNAESASIESSKLEAKIQQLTLRQAEVETMRLDYQASKDHVNSNCKLVPASPDMSRIVQALSLEVDGLKVLDQSFTAGNTSMKTPMDGFSVQPLAVTLHADFDSIFSVIQNVESMNRLVRVSSIRLTRRESDADSTAPALEAAIGLHAMYDNWKAE